MISEDSKPSKNESSNRNDRRRSAGFGNVSRRGVNFAESFSEMNSSDMKDILGRGGSSGSPDTSLLKLTAVDKKKSGARKPMEEKIKRPEGMHRELYNLLVQQNKGKQLSSMMPISKGYRNSKIQLGMRPVRKWIYTEFEHEGREDGLRLKHWMRVDKIDEKPYIFAKYNKKIKVPEYSDSEYEKNLANSSWTKAETDHLFELCRRFDLRWPIITDRWDRTSFPNESRTMEDLKERYYWVVNELNSVRETGADKMCYDVMNEKNRKEQLIKQWNRTKEEIEEEEQLVAEMKKIEARKREREKMAQDLQKLINNSMTERAPLSPALSSAALSPAPSTVMKKKTIRSNKTSSLANLSTLSQSPLIAPSETAQQLRFSEFKSSGAHLRSHEMKLPTNVGQRKIKTLDQVVQGLKIDMPHATEDFVAAYNDFRSNVIMLQELKTALQNAEYELESLKSQASANGGPVIEIEPRIRISNESMCDDPSIHNDCGPSSKRTIARLIDLGNGAPQGSRKRKAPATPMSQELKRSRRN
ncbi:hypothetical protein QR680_009335 [Steinernema hermaphroditum]|uniref:DNA methyltransferase 1-associated protein 1 n=1 Tax=Steinernema hermaphroditum TaxID=289476 RepID=A0AA39IMC5_9BILA|nr:hypothetical protein QR680_009335 [Steinernema hermaphroditum]